MNIYIHIEWTKRELDSSLLMATLAADKGANIFLSDSDSFIFLLKKNLIKPGVFHTKSLVHDSRKQKFIENLKSEHLNVTDFFRKLIKKKKRVTAFALHEDWNDIGIKKTYDKYKQRK